ncbi:unnamed protein product, partial [Brassica rapa]
MFCLPVSVLPSGSCLRWWISSSDHRPALPPEATTLTASTSSASVSGRRCLHGIVLAGTARSTIQFFVVRLPLAPILPRVKIGSSVVRLRRRRSSVASSGSGGRKWFLVLTRVSLIAGRSSTWKMTC